jgi:preprotein translocase subunit SecE
MPRPGKYISEVIAELRKASWPWDLSEKGFKRFRELSDSTVVVLIATLLLGAFVAFNDFIMQSIVWMLTRLSAL